MPRGQVLNGTTARRRALPPRHLRGLRRAARTTARHGTPLKSPSPTRRQGSPAGPPLWPVKPAWRRPARPPAGVRHRVTALLNRRKRHTGVPLPRW